MQGNNIGRTMWQTLAGMVSIWNAVVMMSGEEAQHKTVIFANGRRVSGWCQHIHRSLQSQERASKKHPVPAQALNF
jgi:ribosome-interacting GTPase 1